MQDPNMKSTEPESVPVLENFQENVELPAVAIRENRDSSVDKRTKNNLFGSG